MKMVSIREPQLSDKEAFIQAVVQSVSLHEPWVKAPSNAQEFEMYFARYQHANQKSYVVIDAHSDAIVGVFNLNDIVRGAFQSAYLGYYAMGAYVGQGYMSSGLKLVMRAAFRDLSLHRLEANIQPGNEVSIHLVQQNGFRKEGYSPRYLNINGHWCDHERWAITSEDWVEGASYLSGVV